MSYTKGKYTPYWSTFPTFTSYFPPLPPSHTSRPQPLPAALPLPLPLLPSPVPACLPLFLPVLPSGLFLPFSSFFLLLFLLLSLLLFFTLLLQLRSHISHDGSFGPPTSPSSLPRCSRSHNKKNKKKHLLHPRKTDIHVLC